MSIYTLSKDLLIGAKNKNHCCDLLFVFPQNNIFKVAIDKSNKVLDIYSQIAAENYIIKTWLDFLSNEPNSFEKINIDVPDGLHTEDIFLEVCRAVKNQQILFVYSHQNWEKYQYKTGNTIEYKGSDISILDRDEAIKELQQHSVGATYITDSIVADRGSSISNTKK